MEVDYYHWTRQEAAIAQGALTNSRHPDMHVRGVYPTHAVKAQDCYLWDNQKNKYIDFICGLGTNLLGYGNQKIAEAVTPYLNTGICPSLPTPDEYHTVDSIRRILPMAERVKFLKTGSEACMAAVTMARAFTGKTTVLSEGYHGHLPEFTQLTPPANGCPFSMHMLKLGAQQNFDNVAAVIIEPCQTDYSEERRQWLYWLYEETRKSGTVLIFDEVITGLRFEKYSVARQLNIEPDLVILGKALANGFPLAAVCGKKEIMDGNYFVSSTYAGDVVSLAACRKTIDLLLTDSDYKLENLHTSGAHFIEQFNAIAPSIVELKGYPTRGRFHGTDLNLALFFQEMAAAGVLFCRSWFYNFSLVEHDYEVLTLCREVLLKIKRGGVELRGAMPTSPFAVKVRGNG